MINISPYKVILLDIDNTLYPYDPAHEAGLRAWCAAAASLAGLSLENAHTEYALAQKAIHRSLAAGGSSHSRLLYSQIFAEKFHQNLLIALRLEDTYWEAFLKAMVIFPGVQPFLEKCQMQGIPVCIVSDLTVQIQLKKLETLGILSHIAYCVTSEESGHDKPHPASFLLALHKVGVLPQEALMIGDHFQKDIEGAQSLGIAASLPHFDNKEE